MIDNPLPNQVMEEKEALYVNEQFEEHCANTARKIAEDNNYLGIKKTLKSYHKFNEHSIVESIINEIKNGFKIGLISDAGTPGISDPGYLIVKKCIDNDIEVECLPGPTALIPALVISGLPCERFTFEGFLPIKKGRKSRLEELINEKRGKVIDVLNQVSKHKIKGEFVIVVKGKK